MIFLMKLKKLLMMIILIAKLVNYKGWISRMLIIVMGNIIKYMKNNHLEKYWITLKEIL